MNGWANERRLLTTAAWCGSDLDLTTSTPLYQAYMRTSPSVADLDGDGRLEIVVGSSVGFLYAFDSTGTGRCRATVVAACDSRMRAWRGDP